jgi:hypothetical protein
VESPSYDLNSHPGCESASIGEALAVWRGGQGGASTPPSEQDLYSAERLRMRNVAYTSVTKDLEKAGCSLEVGLSRRWTDGHVRPSRPIRLLSVC